MVNRDVVGYDKSADEYLFCDCSAESPEGRRSLCYDREGLESRKEHRPENSAIDLAKSMGIELLTEEQYRELQRLGMFDSKTSSWLWTPPKSGSSAAHSSATFDMVKSSSTTTALNPIMPYEASAVCCEFNANKASSIRNHR